MRFTATADPPPRWWSSWRGERRQTGKIYCTQIGVAWGRERGQTTHDTDKRYLGCSGSRTRWRINCNKNEYLRLGVTGRQCHRVVLTVKNIWCHWRGTRLKNFGNLVSTRRPETFRILLQLSAKQSHVMHQMMSRRLSWTQQKITKFIWNSHRRSKNKNQMDAR